MKNCRFKSAVTTKAAVLLTLLMLATYNFLRYETPTTRDLPSQETGQALSAVDVQHEPQQRLKSAKDDLNICGEVRESTGLIEGVKRLSNSRGGGQTLSGIADRGTTFAIYDYTVPPWKEPTKRGLSPDVAGSTLTKGKEK